ncbi:cupin domain-containing protein [Dongia sp.]|uniref:cupin domain-containing protein n=1 Tax=Dongia sp. TaxID=1977262 RepID=UPI0035AF68BB
MSQQHPTMPRPIPSAVIPWQEFSDIPRFASRYRHLTRAALGMDYRIGVAIEELAPGMQSAPAHYHIFEEEHVFILEGALSARIGDDRYPMREGSYVCFPAGQKAGHCLINDSGATCRYVVVGERNPNEVCIYPDSNKVMVRALGQNRILDLGASRGYWDGEDTGLPPGVTPPSHAPATAPAAAVKPYPPISAHDVAFDDMHIDSRFGGSAKHLTHAAVGANYRVGMLIEAPAPGQRLAPLHYHMVEEEHALILEGEVRLFLGDESFDMKPGDYACFPAGQKVGHAFMNSGTGPCRYLMIGARDPNDVCVYPQSNKMAVNALRSEDCVFDMAALRGYWDGEKAG